MTNKVYRSLKPKFMVIKYCKQSFGNEFYPLPRKCCLNHPTHAHLCVCSSCHHLLIKFINTLPYITHQTVISSIESNSFAIRVASKIEPGFGIRLVFFSVLHAQGTKQINTKYYGQICKIALQIIPQMNTTLHFPVLETCTYMQKHKNRN